MTDREVMKMALEALCSSNPIGHALEDYAYHNKATEALRQALAQPKREWVGLTDDDWEQLWQDIEDACDEGEVAYQEEAQKKHGEGHYYISSEDQWEGDKRTIRDLVEAKLKEKNGGAI